MSDQYNPLGVHGLIRPERPSGPPAPPSPPRWNLTQNEQQLQPIYQQEMATEIEGRNKIQPLRKILDLLQRPQYMSANLVNGILRGDTAKEVLTSVWAGLTGKEKGSYEDVIREHFTEFGEKKVFGGAPEESWRGQLDLAKIGGFLGDVFLDPTTYIGFGASKGAAKAARAFADDAARVAAREMAQGVAEKGAIEAIQGPMAKALNKVWRESYRDALRRTTGSLQGEMAERAGKFAGDSGLDDLISKVSNKYGQAGESAWNLGILGRSEVGKGVREGYNKGMRSLSHAIKENPASSKLTDAWWSVMNYKPIAALREMVNIRNPHQKLQSLRAGEAGGEAVQEFQGRMARDVVELTRDLDDETGAALWDVIVEAETRQGALAGEAILDGVPVSVGDMLRDPVIMQKLNVKDPEKLQPIADGIRKLMDDWKVKAVEITDELGMPMGEISDYFPTVIKSGSMTRTGAGAGAGYTKHRRLTKATHTEVDIERVAWLNGVTTQEASDMVARNPGLLSITNNLQEAMLARGMAQAKLAGHANIVKEFKEFGIPIDQIGGKTWNIHKGVDLPEIGMKTIDHPAFAGLLFDYETAKVAERALDLTSPKNINQVQEMFHKFTSFWKRVVTMTPGFHARNFYSNQFTQIIKHGASAMDPRKMTDSLAGMLYALDKGNLKKAAADFGIDEGILAKSLNHRYGNFTVKELADEAARRNVISAGIMGHDAQTLMEEVGTKASANPLSKNFAGVKASRWMGERVENLARFQSFLMDYGDVASKGLDDVADVAQKMLQDDEALTYASREAKKWFLDYGDLSEFEQRTLKEVIPFYSWLRKNISNQVQAVVLYPEIFSTVPKLEDFFTYDHPDYDPDLLPEWMKQLGMFPTGKMEDGSFRMFNPNFPYQDLNKIPLVWEEDSWLPRVQVDELRGDLVSAMNPLIRSFVSTVMTEKGYNFFYQDDLRETGDAPYLMRLFASNPGIIGMFDSIQRFRGLEPGMDVDDSGKLQIDPKIAQLLELNMPLLKWAEMMFYMPLDATIPGLEELIEEKTGAVDSYEGAAETLQLLSRWLGIKFTPANLEELKADLGRDIYYRSRDILNEQNRDLPGAETRRLDYRNRTDQTIRRLGG